MAARRFSQAISEGDGISLLVEVDDLEAARRAKSDGADAVVVRSSVDGVRDATELPILWRSTGPLAEAAHAGADACLVAVADVPVSNREQVIELERAGVDAVIVGARNVAELVGEAHPPV